MTFTHDIQIRWNDLDPLRHVNHATLLMYMEQARIEYLRTQFTPPADEDDWAIARVEIDFRSEVAWGDDVTVSVQPTRLGRSSVTVLQHLETQRDLAAEALVAFARWSRERRRSVPLTDAFRASVARQDPDVVGRS